MSNYPDSLDDLPIFSPSTSKAKSEPVPMVKSFRNNVSRRVGLRQKKNGRKGAIRGGSPRRGKMAESVYNVGSSARRVVVKARVVKMNNSYGKKSAGLHMKYIERDGAEKTEKRRNYLIVKHRMLLIFCTPYNVKHDKTFFLRATLPRPFLKIALLRSESSKAVYQNCHVNAFQG
jgi:hypothetical protein